ncbi:hypothetical protein ON010_g1188 [Phytophthora cinnamomi]|nr:hypothetical protein ON010_g1188 [Phytophthora cinnamomi]
MRARVPCTGSMVRKDAHQQRRRFYNALRLLRATYAPARSSVLLARARTIGSTYRQFGASWQGEWLNRSRDYYEVHYIKAHHESPRLAEKHSTRVELGPLDLAEQYAALLRAGRRHHFRVQVVHSAARSHLSTHPTS